MTDFDYKKYSLKNLEKWVEDAMNSAEASPQEIYDTIRKVVEENYYYHKYHTGRCYELLALLNGNGEGHLSCNKDDKSPECQKAWNDFWEENYYPEEYQQYNEEELNAMCEKAASDEEKNKCREYNLRAVSYYNKRSELDAKQDEVVKWCLPVELDGLTGECYIQLPDDLLEAADLKEGDQVQWIDREDGSFEMRKVNGTK